MTRLVKQKVQLLCVLALFASTYAGGQSLGKLYKQGIIAFYEENFKAAEFYFSKIEETGKTKKDSDYRLAISRMVQNKYRDEPIASMLKFEDQEGKDKFYHYWMGRIYANKYMFPQAVESWNKFLESNGKKSDEIIKETNSFIGHTQKLVNYFDNPDNFEIHQLSAPINTEFAEVSPLFMLEKDELIFASNRENPDEDKFNMYEAVNTESGWKKPEVIEVVGHFNRETANAELVNEDGKLFVYKGTARNGNLYYSEKKETGWSVALEFDEQMASAGIAAHFFINEHEDRVIFAKNVNREGLNLMQSFKDPATGEWEDPHPIALNINSPYNEDSPYLTPDEKTLYFSSDRPDGVGALDIYKTTFDESTNTWSEPENLGWPINSPDDEINFKLNPDQKSGYLSSNRLHSKGDYDIYFFWQIQKTKIEGRVVDANTGEPVREGEIRFQPTQYLDEYFRAKIGPDGKYSTEVISNETFLVEAHIGTDTLFLTTFDLVSAEGEKITHHKDFYINTTNDNTLSPDALVKDDRIVAKQQGETFGKRNEQKTNTTSSSNTSASNTTSTTNTQASNDDYPRVETVEEKTVRESPTNFRRRNVVVKNLYFEFGTSKLKQESEARLRELYNYMKSNPQKRVEISGHTDNIGSRQTNLAVSQQRAESVKKWLVKNGIDANRIKTQGYGESRPIASNDDEVNGRELNRRIEINVID